jgi:hypothetical protein
MSINKITFLERHILRISNYKICLYKIKYYITRIINLKLTFRTLRLCQRYILINIHAMLRFRE